MDNDFNKGAEKKDVPNTFGGSKENAEKDANLPLTQQVKDQALEIAHVTQQKASDLAGQVQNQVTAKLTDQKGVASEALKQVAEAVRQAGEGLRGQQQPALGGYADSASEALHKVSDYLNQNDLPTITRDVETAARQRPALFLGGAFLMGLFIGRLVRSSGRNVASTPANRVYDPLLPAKLSSSSAFPQ